MIMPVNGAELGRTESCGWSPSFCYRHGSSSESMSVKTVCVNSPHTQTHTLALLNPSHDPASLCAVLQNNSSRFFIIQLFVFFNKSYSHRVRTALMQDSSARPHTHTHTHSPHCHSWNFNLDCHKLPPWLKHRGERAGWLIHQVL